MDGIEYLIDVTAVYIDGTKDSIMIRQKDQDGESARNTVANFFKNYQKRYGVKSLTTTVVGPERSQDALRKKEHY